VVSPAGVVLACVPMAGGVVVAVPCSTAGGCSWRQGARRCRRVGARPQRLGVARVNGRTLTEPGVASVMPAMTAATVTATTVTATTVTATTVTATTVTAATMEAAALVETARAKAAAVETPAESKPDPDGNGNSIAISAIIGVIRFGISVVGLIFGRVILGVILGVISRIIGWIGPGSGCAGKAGRTVGGCHLIVLGG
jgi:hypothetical protein